MNLLISLFKHICLEHIFRKRNHLANSLSKTDLQEMNVDTRLWNMIQVHIQDNLYLFILSHISFSIVLDYLFHTKSSEDLKQMFTLIIWIAFLDLISLSSINMSFFNPNHDRPYWMMYVGLTLMVLCRIMLEVQ